MKFGLIVIGDEILNGRRTDAHFPFVKQALLERGLQLAWVEYVADVRADIVQRLARSALTGLPVLVTGLVDHSGCNMCRCPADSLAAHSRAGLRGDVHDHL